MEICEKGQSWWGGGLKKEGDRNYTKKRGLEMMNEVLKKETNIKTKKEKKD